jgi:putative nucleotidyltransferase with HDIG domain
MRIPIDKQLLKSLTLIGSLIEARDAYTGGHVWRVSQYARKLAEAYGLPSDRIFLASLGGFLHDIGKIVTPDQILHKRGKLTAAEFEVIKTHPGVGALYVQEHPLANLVLPAVHQHHERLDGRGYPNGQQGEEISTYSRIVGIADVFDAITSTRPYHRGMPTAAAVEVLRSNRGTQFDPALSDVFIRLAQENTFDSIVGHSDWGIPLAHCPNCGPVISIERDTPDGESGACRVCGIKHRIHRLGNGFEIESLGIKGSAAELQPQPEKRIIEDFVAQAPEVVEI